MLFRSAIEHSIEFRAVFLQQMLGNDFKILPILCGPFAKALYTGEAPERDDHVMRFFDALGELAEDESAKLFWVLGIDLAHVGMRYGDEMVAIVGGEEMEAVKAQDEERLALACEGRTEDFFDLVKPEQDRLKWCGLSPLYTFLNVLPDARGEVLRYDQWNIDEQSVVSFTAMEFHERS